MPTSDQSAESGRRGERLEWLDLCGADGMRYALPYRELRSIEMPSQQLITLRFVDRRVVVHGRNLGPVYEDLIRGRVAQLREDDVDWAAESETFISRLAIVRFPEHD
jgi:hypothetical protein